MKLLTAFGLSFLCALAAILAVMLAADLFGSHNLKPAAAVGISAGIGLASTIRTWKGLSTHTFAVLVGILAALGSATGGWLSNGWPW